MMVMSWASRGCLLRSDASTFRLGSLTWPYVEPSRPSSTQGVSSDFACAWPCRMHAACHQAQEASPPKRPLRCSAGDPLPLVEQGASLRGWRNTDQEGECQEADAECGLQGPKLCTWSA